MVVLGMTKQERLNKIAKEGTTLLKGKTVKRVRSLTDEEKAEYAWYSAAPVIEFEDGTIVFPSRDSEGNDAGALFGELANGSSLIIAAV